MSSKTMKNLKLTPTYDTHKRLDMMEHRKLFNLIVIHMYSKMYDRNVIDGNWGLVVKLALPGKVTRRAYKVFGIYDRFPH
jgi:hypothetical protein